MHRTTPLDILCATVQRMRRCRSQTSKLSGYAPAPRPASVDRATSLRTGEHGPTNAALVPCPPQKRSPTSCSWTQSPRYAKAGLKLTVHWRHTLHKPSHHPLHVCRAAFYGEQEALLSMLREWPEDQQEALDSQGNTVRFFLYTGSGEGSVGCCQSGTNAVPHLAGEHCIQQACLMTSA